MDVHLNALDLPSIWLISGQTARPNDQRYDDTYKYVWYCNDTRTSGNGIPKWKQVHVDKGAKKADGTLVTAADIGKKRFEVGDTALFIPGPGKMQNG